MFNDRYGLTEAVLERRKIMTRREANIVCFPGHKEEQIIRFYKSKIFEKGRQVWFGYDINGIYIADIIPQYVIGEEVAVAQRYWDLRNNDDFYKAILKSGRAFPLECIKYEKGCHNKMFVRAEWMPHRIRITDIKAERLQDISDEDIYKEGFDKACRNNGWGNAAYHWETLLVYYDGLGRTKEIGSCHPKDAFADLIDKVSGRGTWERNPWVFVYTFRLVQ